MSNRIYAAVMGHCMGDALGVPVEFVGRDTLSQTPVKDMRAFGTYRQQAGTWSDDTSLSLCLLDSLARGVDYTDIMTKFRLWLEDGAYTARGDVFDVGIATRNAITRFAVGKPPFQCGSSSDYDNGNGSLMRILPLLFYLEANFGPHRTLSEDSLEIIHRVSALTHAHKRSQIGCGIYLSVASQLGQTEPLVDSVYRGLEEAFKAYEDRAEFKEELAHYSRLIDAGFCDLDVSEINSSGYVVDTLEAAIWCLITTQTYKDCVLKAVNLGGDTDTVAAVAGGLAGLHYGADAFPEEWVKVIARSDFIESLCLALEEALENDVAV